MNAKDIATDPATMTGAQAARAIAAGEITSEMLVRACLDRIAARDEAVGAWIWLDPELALERAREADRVLASGNGVGPLHGVPVGIKDIIETRDMPTQNGFAGHEGRHTHRDAFCVSQLRDAGAVVLGKTVTTELAVRTPGKTKHPRRPTHTPGGSSSGSAAAVADGQVPFALGTQTGGSVIRPASFCGIHGFKPSFGLIGRTGVTQMAPWLDTVGTYGRSVEDVALLAEQMLASDAGDPQAAPRSRPPLARIAMQEPPRRPRLAFARTAVWGKAEPAAARAIEDFASALGSDCQEIELPGWMAEAWDWHGTLQIYGIAQCYGPLADEHGDKMSQSLRDRVAEGRGMTERSYREAVAQRARLAAGLDEIYKEYDAILCLPAPGTPPEDLTWTGDPVFNAFWTYAGTPCVSLPLLEIDGMPLGVQLTGPRGGDGPLLRTARWLEARTA
jgi:Asp-tRNA(Asn)/Glu-tRNA(Gln) amidotransferase A subunit family amidase